MKLVLSYPIDLNSPVKEDGKLGEHPLIIEGVESVVLVAFDSTEIKNSTDPAPGLSVAFKDSGSLKRAVEQTSWSIDQKGAGKCLIAPILPGGFPAIDVDPLSYCRWTIVED